jgi:hypothetical protein
MTEDEKDRRIEELEDKLEKIARWCEAYPVESFKPMSKAEWEKARRAIDSYSWAPSIDRISASNFRHVLGGITKIITQ